jgi:3-(3-hydroxy-phenyl)propionate hydroxylase
MKSDSVVDQVDVAVIGCGTTGLALARLLELEGLRVAVVDRNRLPFDFPRATHLDDETMRAFQTLGLAHLEKSFSLVGTYSHFDSEWRRVMTMDLNRGLTEQGWQSDYMFHQPDFEAVLRGHAYKHAETATYFGWDAFDLHDSGEQVMVSIRERSTSEERQINASFAVGCDGANSRVREFMGAGQVDYNATHRSLIVDILPFVTKEALPGRDAFIQGGIRNPLTFVPITEPRLRFELMLRPDDDTALFERTERAYEVLAPWFSAEEYRLLRSDVYEWRSLIADPWRVGRVLLAGDAAHTMPPHLGQGMCSGIRDATNLAWKLKRVVRNESPIDLLDTYESERSPHVTTYVVVAAELANNIEVMEASASGEPIEVAAEAMRPRIGPGVRAGDADEFAGMLSAQPRLANGELLDDVVGYRFAVVGEPACVAATSTATKAHLQRLDVAIVDEASGGASEWLSSLGVAALVVRPDRYIFGTARSGVELDALVSQVETALTRSAVAAPGA